MAEKDEASDGVRAEERARIAAWLKAKADETQDLLTLAAERGDPEAKGAQLWFAKKTRALVNVLAIMIERDTLVLRGDKDGAP